MLCLEDCAQAWWSGGGGGGGGGKGEESTGLTKGLCGSSCCSHCTHAVDGLVGMQFHNRSYNVESGSSGAEVRMIEIFDPKVACGEHQDEAPESPLKAGVGFHLSLGHPSKPGRDEVGGSDLPRALGGAGPPVHEGELRHGRPHRHSSALPTTRYARGGHGVHEQET